MTTSIMPHKYRLNLAYQEKTNPQHNWQHISTGIKNTTKSLRSLFSYITQEESKTDDDDSGIIQYYARQAQGHIKVYIPLREATYPNQNRWWQQKRTRHSPYVSSVGEARKQTSQLASQGSCSTCFHRPLNMLVARWSLLQEYNKRWRHSCLLGCLVVCFASLSVHVHSPDTPIHLHH